MKRYIGKCGKIGITGQIIGVFLILIGSPAFIYSAVVFREKWKNGNKTAVIGELCLIIITTVLNIGGFVVYVGIVLLGIMLVVYP